MKKMLTLLVAASFALGTTSFAAAAPEKPKKKRDPAAVFKKLDANADGKLSVEEFVGKREGQKKEAAEKRFKRLDKDGDGSLTLAEFTAKPKKKKKDK